MPRSTGGRFDEAELQPKDPRIGRFRLEERDLSIIGPVTARFDRSWLWSVIDDGSDLAPVLVQEMRAVGLKARLLAWSDEPRLSSDTRCLLFLGRVRQTLDCEAALEVNRCGFCWAKALVGVLAGRPGAFITVQETGGDFGLSGNTGIRAWTGGLSALVKTATREWADVDARAIDLEHLEVPPEQIARGLVIEILGGGGQAEVGLRAGGRRTTLVSVRAELPDVAVGHGLERGSVIVASGGARGVTAAALVALARASQPRFALLGRSKLDEEPAWAAGAETFGALTSALLRHVRSLGESLHPMALQQHAQAIINAREIEATLTALRQAGSEAVYLAVDVADAASVREKLARVREMWGPIRGIVHGAGLLTDKLIRDKTLEQLDRVFAAKAGGLIALLDATRDDPLETIVLFSSVAARLGNFGQADYAMANEVLNKVAAVLQRERGRCCLVKSLNWGPWDGGMVTPTLKPFLENKGLVLMPLHEGARRFVEELYHRSFDGIEIGIGGSSHAAS